MKKVEWKKKYIQLKRESEKKQNSLVNENKNLTEIKNINNFDIIKYKKLLDEELIQKNLFLKEIEKKNGDNFSLKVLYYK